MKKILTSIQKQIIDMCEPLIEILCTRFEEWVLLNIKKIEDQKLNPEFNIENLNNTILKKYKPGSIEIDLILRVFDKNQFPISQRKMRDIVINEDEKNLYIEQQKRDIRILNLGKLTEVVRKYVTSDFVEVSGKIECGVKGFEFIGVLTDDQNRIWNFNTRAIEAGGYRIQEFHYRYITTLSCPEVPKNYIKEKISAEDRAEKEKQKQIRLDLHNKRIHDDNVKRVIGKIKSMHNVYKDALESIEHNKSLLKDETKLKEVLVNWMNKMGMQKDINYLKSFLSSELKRDNQRLLDLADMHSDFYDDKGKLKYSKEQLFNIVSSKLEILKEQYKNFL